MQFVPIYQKDGSEYAVDESGFDRKVYTYYGRYKKGVQKPTEGVNGGDRLMYTNWKRLTDEEKAEAEARVWIFDEDSGEWDPQ